MSKTQPDKRGRILVVDDEKGAREALADILTEDGYQVSVAADGVEGFERVQADAPDVVISDFKMPRLDGINLLRKSLTIDPDLKFVLMTAFGTIKTAVEAMKLGAEDYLVKPVNLEEVQIVIARCLKGRRLVEEARGLRERLDEKYRFDNIVGNSPQMQLVFKTVEQIAPSRSNVLITGESGTGKELIAQAIHQHSPRKDKAFVVLNCASLTETLLESELFGHEKGSFTGATGRRRGRLEQADGGTLFLDEVGEVPQSTQVKLLRFLQSREIERVGGNEVLKLDVRVVTATHRDLKQLIESETFREDLFYRLNVIEIGLPPLRERKGDIPALSDFFIRRYAAENRKQITGIEEAALQDLIRYDWPGNIRELENIIERAVVLAGGKRITQDNLPELAVEPGKAANRFQFTAGVTLGEAEREIILRTLDAVGGHVPRAAELLGISPRKIYYRLKEYGHEARSKAS
ncbi:MAG: sigma-54 dependent transcriptional regulator [Deltaproteobacteria bacterium]|nr:sigma-54 dependent transcriptional regulator [Deltaproteobacteria bacterium]